MIFWEPAEDFRSKPVALIGAGVLGRRIGCIWASAGYNVQFFDPNESSRTQALAYIREHVQEYAQKIGNREIGLFDATDSLAAAVANAWLVVECVPEKLEAKIQVFTQLETLTHRNAILASNSSSYRSSEMLSGVKTETRSRVLNMHYFMPPACMVLELMTCGHTDPAIITFLVERTKESGTLPYVARKESTGFIFNRLWAAVKRETLTILAEDVSTPAELDSIWAEMFVKGRSLPCELMDAVGLDTVANIENHYVHERGLSPEKTVQYLEDNFLRFGKLGNKSDKGGLYPTTPCEASNDKPEGLRILALDIGLSTTTGSPFASGELVELARHGQIRTVLKGLNMPDGLAVDPTTRQLFWTCMGIPGKGDGGVYSANLDGSGVKTIIAPEGTINTPKQLALDASGGYIYFCDREGSGVYRCKYDGTGLSKIVDNAQPQDDVQDVLSWCVGVTVAPSLGRFFWTQKGPPKGGKGRIFSAKIPSPEQAVVEAESVRIVLGNLPEPIDLEIDEVSRMLYWTDRGEIPSGNSLCRIQLDDHGNIPAVKEASHEILTKHFHEPIGLKLVRSEQAVYVTDLGGSIYCYNLESGEKTTLFTEAGRAFTGITVL